MANLIGALTSKTMAPGSPTVRGEDGNEQLTEVSRVPASMLASSIPAYGSACTSAIGYHHLVMSTYSVKPLDGGSVYELTVNYTALQISITTHADADEEISLSVSSMEKDISTHPNYLASWNHSLCFAPEIVANGKGSKTTPAETAPDGIAESKTPVIEGKSWWQWIRIGDQIPQGWIVQSKPTKKCVQSYIIACPVITSKKYYKSYTRASNAASASNVGDWATPSKTFGKSGYWLVVDVSVQEEGKYWTVCTRYQNSMVRDSQIYPVPLDTNGGNA